MSDLVKRLRGEYTVPVNDGAGPLQGKTEFTRTFEVAPISIEAADRIEALEAELKQQKSLALSAGIDAERAITALDKARLDLRCLEESTVDVKAFRAQGVERDKWSALAGDNLLAMHKLEREKLLLKAERDALKHDMERAVDRADTYMRSNMELEAERDKLREALQDIVDCVAQTTDSYGNPGTEICQADNFDDARAALAKHEKEPADEAS